MKTNERSELLLGKEALETLNDKTVLVVGVGGVGSFCVEALARTGIGHLILIDKDCVEPSNINRQLVATLDTVNEVKVDVLKKIAEYFNVTTDYLLGISEVKRDLQGQMKMNKTLDTYYDLIEIYKGLDEYDQELVWSIMQTVKKTCEKRKSGKENTEES